MVPVVWTISWRNKRHTPEMWRVKIQTVFQRNQHSLQILSDVSIRPFHLQGIEA